MEPMYKSIPEKYKNGANKSTPLRRKTVDTRTTTILSTKLCFDTLPPLVLLRPWRNRGEDGGDDVAFDLAVPRRLYPCIEGGPRVLSRDNSPGFARIGDLSA
jgi:hypothetical protein